MKIRALQSFTIRDAESGNLKSAPYGCVLDVDDTLGAQLIQDNLAEEYTLISPTGSATIAENGTVDVTEYASVVVNVPVVTVTYDVNGGTGTVNPVNVGKGSAINLNDGTGITPPENKTFSGWATTDSAVEADVTSPYTVTADITLYAVYVDTPTEG